MGHNRILRRRMIAMAAIVAVPVAGASAQRRPPEPVPRVMVTTFQSAEKELGVKAAEELRNRITRDVDARKVFVIPKADIAKSLPADKNALVVAYCGGPTCNAYAAAAKAAKELGYTNVKHLSAGISGWKDAKAPLEK